MKDKIRILFMGTPEFAVASLSKLIKYNYDVVGVVTAPDRPSGRGRKCRESAVKKYAKQKQLRCLQPTNLKNPEFLKELISLKANLQIVVAFRMLPRVVWELPKFGTINLHASLLPEYRGAAPINWVLINGETKTGVTTFFIDEKIDTGAIILQKEVDISMRDNAGSLHDKLMFLGSDLVIDTVELISKEQVRATFQQHKKNLKTAPKLNKENCRINWNKPGKDIFNLIRGLNPIPAAWTQLELPHFKKLDVKIYKGIHRKELHDIEIGSVLIKNNQILIAVSDGIIQINEIKLPGKRRMDAQSLLNGFNIPPNSKMR